MAEGPVERAFLNLVTEDLEASRHFYERLGYRPRFESDWFVQLAHSESPSAELGLLFRESEVVPPELRSAPSGVLFTIVVANVDDVYVALKKAGAEIVEAPRNLFYGQRRMLVRAPEGTVVDISSECPPDPRWMARVRPTDDGGFREQ